jgi:hypothetical protein
MKNSTTDSYRSNCTLHERDIHSLVDDASTIFSEITQEYGGSDLNGDIQDFNSVRFGKMSLLTGW